MCRQAQAAAHLCSCGSFTSLTTGIKSFMLFWYIRRCFALRLLSGKNATVTSVPKCVVASATAALIPGLRWLRI